jgi:hypothetical protein
VNRPEVASSSQLTTAHCKCCLSLVLFQNSTFGPVIVFGQPAALTATDGDAGPAGRPTGTTSSGFIPVEPWVDLSVTAATDGDPLATDTPADGLVQPLVGETIDQFNKRRTVELNELTRQRPHDEVRDSM